MGVRLMTEHFSEEGTGWVCQIHDTLSGDIQTYVDCVPEGFVINHDGDSRNKWNRVMSTTVDVGFMVRQSVYSLVDFFMSDMKNAEEGRFYMRIIKGLNTYFVGPVVMDEVVLEDYPGAYLMRISATDGIGTLRDKNWSDTTGSIEVPYTGYMTFHTIVQKCIEKLNVLPYYVSHSDIIWETINYFDASHNTAGNPLDQTGVDLQAFYTVNGSNKFEYKSCLDVLEEIMKCFNARLYYADGRYRVEQINERNAASYKVWKYGLTGSGTSAMVSDNVTIDKVVHHRLAIGRWGYIPPLQKVIVTYEHGEQDVNGLSGVVIKGNNNPVPVTPVVYDLGSTIIDVSDFYTLRFSARIKMNSAVPSGFLTSNRWKNHRYVFKLMIKLSGAGVGPYYYKRVNQSTNNYYVAYSTPAWVGTEDTYEFLTGIVDVTRNGENIFDEIYFETNKIPIEATGLIKLETKFWLDKVIDEQGINIVPAIGYVCSHVTSDLKLEWVDKDREIKRPTSTISEAIGSVKNSKAHRMELSIGDGPNKTYVGRLRTPTVDTTLWGKGGAGSLKIHELTAREILAGQATALRVMSGDVFSKDINASTRVSYNGENFMLMTGRQITRNDTWSGEWVSVGSPATTGITVSNRLKTNNEYVHSVPTELPDDEQKEWQTKWGVTKTNNELVKDTVVNNIPLSSPAPYDMYRTGDVLNVIDPVSGNNETVTVAQDVKKGDTVIQIVSNVMDYHYPPGSYIEGNASYEVSNTYTETGEAYQDHMDFTGTDWTITVATLPTHSGTGAVDAVTIAKRVKVYKNGQKLKYIQVPDPSLPRGYRIDNATNRIILNEVCYGEIMEAYINKINK